MSVVLSTPRLACFGLNGLATFAGIFPVYKLASQGVKLLTLLPASHRAFCLLCRHFICFGRVTTPRILFSWHGIHLGSQGTLLLTPVQAFRRISRL